MLRLKGMLWFEISVGILGGEDFRIAFTIRYDC